MTARRLGAPLEEVPRAGEARLLEGLCSFLLCTALTFPQAAWFPFFSQQKKKKCKQSNPRFFGKHCLTDLCPSLSLNVSFNDC